MNKKCLRCTVVLAVLFYAVLFSNAVEPKGQKLTGVNKKLNKIATELALEVFLQNKEEFRDKICATIEEYKKIIKHYPDSPNAYTAMGIAYGYLEEDQKAVKSFKKAIKIEPEFISAHTHLGSHYYNIGQRFRKQKKYKEARKEFIRARKKYERALEINPNDESNIKFLKLIVETLTELTEVENRKIDGKRKSQIDKYWKLAAVASNNEDYGQAIKYLWEIEKIEPNYHESIYYNIAREYKNWGKYEKAIEFYKKQILLNPQEKSPRLYSHLGLAESYYKLGEFDKAKQESNTTLKLDPENKRAKRYLEKIKKAEKQK